MDKAVGSRNRSLLRDVLRADLALKKICLHVRIGVEERVLSRGDLPRRRLPDSGVVTRAYRSARTRRDDPKPDRFRAHTYM